MDALGACFECGSPADHQHHVIPASLGGTKTVPLCELHHGQVHDRDFLHHRFLTKAALDAKRSRGERTGECPYGYRVSADGRSLETDAAEQSVISTIITLHRSGLSIRKIVQNLSNLGVVSRKGKPL